MELKRKLSYALCALLICTILPGTADARLKQKTPYKVRWSEHNGRIDTASVCADFARSSLDYRKCRSYAVDVFKRKCRQYTNRVDKAGPATWAREKKLMRKFCSASGRFSP